MGSRSGHKSAVPASKQRTFIKRFWITFVSFIVFIFLLFFSISLGLFGTMPSFEDLENPKSNLATEIFSSDNKILGKYFIENRSNVHYQDLSPNVINALIATEDIRFEKHSGVDVKAVDDDLLVVDDGEERRTTIGVVFRAGRARAEDEALGEGGEFADLFLPLGLERGGGDDQAAAGFAEVVEQGAGGDGLDGFAETHLIGEQGALAKG